MEYFILYLCSIADSLHNFFLIIGIIILIVLVIIIGAFGSLFTESNMFKEALKNKGWIVVGLIFTFLGVIIPTTNQCYAIFGVGTVLNYVNNSDEAKQIPENAMKAVNRYLESLAPNDSIR